MGTRAVLGGGSGHPTRQQVAWRWEVGTAAVCAHVRVVHAMLCWVNFPDLPICCTSEWQSGFDSSSDSIRHAQPCTHTPMYAQGTSRSSHLGRRPRVLTSLRNEKPGIASLACWPEATYQHRYVGCRQGGVFCIACCSSLCCVGACVRLPCAGHLARACIGTWRGS